MKKVIKCNTQEISSMEIAKSILKNELDFIPNRVSEGTQYTDWVDDDLDFDEVVSDVYTLCRGIRAYLDTIK